MPYPRCPLTVLPVFFAPYPQAVYMYLAAYAVFMWIYGEVSGIWCVVPSCAAHEGTEHTIDA